MSNSILLFTFILTLAIGLNAQGDFKFSNDLTEQFKSNNGTYGTGCGIASQDPRLRQETEALILDRNIEVLREWLDSGSNVHNAYAAEAFIRLSNQGTRIDDSIVEKVLVLKRSEAMLSACRGCIYERITLADALSNYDFE